MAQKRMLDKKISVSDQVADLSLLAKLIFTWSIPHADDVGLLPFSLRTLKAIIVPTLDLSLDDFSKAVKEIAEQKLYETFEFEGQKFVKVTKFLNNQTIKKDRQPNTILPIRFAENHKESWDFLIKVTGGIQVESNGNQIDPEGKGKELKGKKRKGTEAITAAELKIKFKSNPLWDQIIQEYPDRNYDLQFDLMCDWWLQNKNQLPKQISAWSNWLTKTKADEKLLARRLGLIEKDQQREMIEKAKSTPQVKSETLQNLREKMKGIGKKI